jgi:hypothetical protein
VGLTRDMAQVAILVEGESDRQALLALAEGQAVDLRANGVVVLAMGGITNIRRYVAELGPQGARLRLAGLYDAAEERFVREGLERGGLTPGLGSRGLAAIGFHRCERDLEDELIRALGLDRVVAVIEAQGDLVSFRTLQQQPAHRGGTTRDHLHRFLGAGSGRKIRYGRQLTASLDNAAVPPPMVAALADALADPH